MEHCHQCDAELEVAPWWWRYEPRFCSLACLALWYTGEGPVFVDDDDTA